MPGPRETAYDEKIFPLMKQIIEICKEHEIPHVCCFELDDQAEEGEDPDIIFCSTAYVPKTAHKTIKEAFHAVRKKEPEIFAFTITSTPKT